MAEESPRDQPKRKGPEAAPPRDTSRAYDVTTMTKVSKNIATIKIIGIIICAIFCVLIIVGIFLYIGGDKYDSSQQSEFMKYLEKQRQYYDSIQVKEQELMQSSIVSAKQRQKRDSIADVEVRRLLTDIKTTQMLYEKMPVYHDLSKDSLRRIYHDYFAK